MKVILQQGVAKLGKIGDVVEASPGYFRNFLQPRKLAVPATEGALKKREEDLEMLAKKAAAAHSELAALAEKINALGKITLSARVGEEGKLYGKITHKEIAHALETQLGTEIDKRLIKTSEDINIIGSYEAIIKLAPDVQCTITVEVVTENMPEEAVSA